MTNYVYHYTDTARLPWILKDGVLTPGRNRIGGFPDPDFLWATRSPVGDGTASSSRDALLAGLTRSVRFVLREDNFSPWHEVHPRTPQWTSEHVNRLHVAARGRSRPEDWWCRLQPLARSAWLAIETRSYTDKVWRCFDPHARLVDLDADTYGIEVEGRFYFSSKTEHPTGAAAYQVFVGDRQAA